MKRTLPSSGFFFALCVTLSLCVHSTSRASTPVPLDQPTSNWSAGDESGTEIWLISRADGTMELHGRDLASTYSGIIIASEDTGTWTCHGTGFRFVGGLSFTYLSTLTLEESGGVSTLVEEWSATLPDGEVIKGKTRLTPVEPKEA